MTADDVALWKMRTSIALSFIQLYINMLDAAPVDIFTFIN